MKASFQCAKIKVPLDYSKPDGDTHRDRRHQARHDRRQEGHPAGQSGRPGRLGLRLRQGRRHHQHFGQGPVRLRHRGLRPPRREALRPGHVPHGQGTRRVPRQDLRPGHRRRTGRGPGRQQGHRRQVRGEDRTGAGPHRHRQRRQGPRHPARRGQRHEAELPRLLLRDLPGLHLRLAVPGQRGPDGPRRRPGPVAEQRGTDQRPGRGLRKGPPRLRRQVPAERAAAR